MVKIRTAIGFLAFSVMLLIDALVFTPAVVSITLRALCLWRLLDGFGFKSYFFATVGCGEIGAIIFLLK